MEKEDKKDIKIFVSYHKPAKIIRTEIIKPIQVGAALKKESLNMLKDDEGINISNMNPLLCELTAQYWAWKNVNTDYYGFMHYRRHFVFCDIPEEPDLGGQIFMNAVDNEYIKKIGLNDDAIRTAIDDYDILVTPQIDVSKSFAPNNEIQFSSLTNLHAKDFDLMIQILEELHPDYKQEAFQFCKGCKAYWYNMYIMKREIFYDYCEWLFPMLFEAVKRIEFSGYDAQEKRTVAFMAERYFSIYMSKMINTNSNIKIKSLKMTFVEDAGEDIGKYGIDLEKNNYDICQGLTKSFNELVKNGRTELGINWDKIALYGAGKRASRYMKAIERYFGRRPELIWDINAKEGSVLDGIPIMKPKFEAEDITRYIWIITIGDEIVCNSIKERYHESGVTGVFSLHDVLNNYVIGTWLNITKRRCNE